MVERPLTTIRIVHAHFTSLLAIKAGQAQVGKCWIIPLRWGVIRKQRIVVIRYARFACWIRVGCKLYPQRVRSPNVLPATPPITGWTINTRRAIPRPCTCYAQNRHRAWFDRSLGTLGGTRRSGTAYVTAQENGESDKGYGYFMHGESLQSWAVGEFQRPRSPRPVANSRREGIGRKKVWDNPLKNRFPLGS